MIIGESNCSVVEGKNFLVLEKFSFLNGAIFFKQGLIFAIFLLYGSIQAELLLLVSLQEIFVRLVVKNIESKFLIYQNISSLVNK